MGKEGGRGALLDPPTHRANIPLAQRLGGGPAPSQAPPLRLPLWGIKDGERVEELREASGQAPPLEVQVSQSQA